MKTLDPHLNGPTPLTSIRIAADEKRELQDLARARGLTLSDAFRQGARVLLTDDRGGGPGAS